MGTDPTITIEYLRDEGLEYLRREIGEIHHRRHLHDEFHAMLGTTQHSDTTSWSHYHRTYIESQVMAIRRLSDTDGRTMSFVRFIREIFGSLLRSAWATNSGLRMYLPSGSVADVEGVAQGSVEFGLLQLV